MPPQMKRRKFAKILTTFVTYAWIASSGEYLAFLDDDDIRLPGSLDLQLQTLANNPAAAFAYGQVLIADPRTSVLTGEVRPERCVAGDIFWTLLNGNFIYIPSVVARREHVIEIGLFNPLSIGAEDWDLLIRLSERYSVVTIEDPVAIYRTFSRASGQTSSNRVAVCRASAWVQAQGLRLPRALAASSTKRAQIRRRYLDWLTDVLACDMLEMLTERDAHATRDDLGVLVSLFASIRLNPRRAGRTICRLLGSLWQHRCNERVRKREGSAKL